jgi:Domain of unknown function (DUF5615)
LKILLDESVPRLVKRSLLSWAVTTVQELGWSAIKNGELLARAREQQFTILITADRNLRYQQPAPRELAILVLPTNRASIIRAILPEIETALRDLRPGGNKKGVGNVFCERPARGRAKPIRAFIGWSKAVTFRKDQHQRARSKPAMIFGRDAADHLHRSGGVGLEAVPLLRGNVGGIARFEQRLLSFRPHPACS